MLDIENEYSLKLRPLVCKVLARDPDAARFLTAYDEYAHRIDDLIDNKVTDPEEIIRTIALSEAVFSSLFYQRNVQFLYPVFRMVSNIYADACVMERSEEKWQKDWADVMRHSGNEIFIAVIDLLGTYEERREISLLLRGNSYYAHHTVNGEPC